MDTLILLLVGFITGYIYFGVRLRSKLEKIINDNGLNLDEDPKDVKIPVYKTEIYDNLILLYDTESNFTTQGNTLEELATNLNLYKNVKVAQVNHEEKMLLFINGQVKENKFLFVPKTKN